MTRFHTGHPYRARCVLRAQIAVQRETVMRKATRDERPYSPMGARLSPARIVPFDNYVLVIGVLTPAEREQLSLAHVEQHRFRNGVAWFPKGTDDAA